MNRKLISLLSILFFTSSAFAEITLYDQNNWKVGLGGFVEFDTMYDTTRSLTEVVGNTAIAKKGTFNGDNGRTQFSLRNTRLSFNIQAPVADGWKSRGYLETDFLGYDPSVAASGTTNSESSFYSNPTLRLRHAYLSAEKDGLQVILGQTWSLFGWQPAYVLSTVSVAPVTGTLYQRSPRIGAVKTMNVGGENDLQLGLSLQRPSQRDGKIPNVDAAIRWLSNARKSGFASANSEIKTQPLSVGLSGTYRNFESPTAGGSTDLVTNTPAFALAANALIPVLASSDGKDVSNTLTLGGEFTVGRGYGDQFPSWTGGLVQQAAGVASAVPSTANLDSGLGGYNSTGAFELLKLQTWNTQLQYHLDGKSFVTTGYGQIWSSNLSDFLTGAGQTAGNLYDRSQVAFLNVAHDCTPQVRVALEFDQFTTHYVNDGAVNHDNRYIFASYFRF